MPIVVRRARKDAGDWAGDGEGEWVDRVPEWQTRPLSADEVERCTTLLMAFLEKKGFTSRQIGQVFYRGEDEKSAGSRVRMRLQRMRNAFTDAGFELGIIP
jgi:hypothetical protein